MAAASLHLNLSGLVANQQLYEILAIQSIVGVHQNTLNIYTVDKENSTIP